MSEGGLGNIFDAAGKGEQDRHTPRGPDFRVEVQIPRSALGGEAGVDAPVPEQRTIDGKIVRRNTTPGDPPGMVRLHLPADFKDGAALRLRGQGGRSEGGRAGDLLLTVRLVDEPSSSLLWWVVLLAVVLAGGAAWALLRT